MTDDSGPTASPSSDGEAVLSDERTMFRSRFGPQVDSSDIRVAKRRRVSPA